MLRRNKRNSVANQGADKLRKRGDIKTGQYNDNSEHLANLEFAKDFENCCNVEFSNEFEDRNEYINDQFGEENMRRNNLECARDYYNKDER